MKRHVNLILLLWGAFTMYSQNPKEIEITEWKESDVPMNICNDPKYGIIVVNTNIPDLDFKILNAEKYLINQLPQLELNRYILCVEPENEYVDTYNIQVASKDIITSTFPVSNIKSQEKRFYYIFEKQRNQICWEEHWSKGNEFFINARYEEAQAEYYLTSECNDVPGDIDLIWKIKDAGFCLETKRKADSFYNADNLDDALREYEKLYALNPNDNYTKNRIETCKIKIENLSRTISGTVTFDGKPMDNVIIEAKYPKQNKQGQIKSDRKKNTETEWQEVGKSDSWGHYEITVLKKINNLRFFKGNSWLDENRYFAEVAITSEKMDIALKQKLTAKPIIRTGTEVLRKELQKRNLIQ